MNETGAPQGADVPSASSSASQPASTGRPTRQSLTQSLRDHKVEKPAAATAIPAAGTEADGTPQAVEPANKPEGDTTANVDAGKGEKKPDDKKVEPETVPLKAFKERLGKEKERRERLEADLHATKGEAARVRAILDAALAENERLTEALASGQKFDEQAEEIRSLKLQNEVKAKLDAMGQEHQKALQESQREAQVTDLAARLRSEVEAACSEFPLVGPAEVRAEMRKHPGADARSLAQAKHEERRALIAKQDEAKRSATATPTTVAKPTGVSKFEPPLTRNGMTQALRHARARG